MEIRAQLHRHRLVGGVADQGVPEPVSILAGQGRPLGADQVLAEQRGEMVVDVRGDRRLRQPADRAGEEVLSADRCAFEDRALRGRQLVDARREQGGDRRRDRHVREVGRRHPAAIRTGERAVVDQLRDHLLDEQWCPASRIGDPRPDVAFELSRTQKVVDQLVALVRRQRLERDREGVRLPPAPPGANVQEVGSRHRQEEDRRLTGEVGDVLDQIEEGATRPLEVVEHDHDRPLSRERLQEPAAGPEDLLGSGHLSDPGELRHAFGDRLPVLVVVEETRDTVAEGVGRSLIGRADRLLHDLDHGEERRPFPVRQAASAVDARRRNAREELFDEARLADPGRSQDRDQVTGRIRHRPFGCLREDGERSATSDHRGIQPANATCSSGHDLADAIRGYPLALSLQLERADRLRGDGIMDEAVGLFADDDLPGLGGLLQARSDVDRVPRHDAISGLVRRPEPRRC